MHARIVMVAAVLALAGCSSGGPVKMGPNTYYLTKKSAGCGFSGGEGSKAELLREADRFCTSKGMQSEAIKETAKNGVPFVRCASAEVTFKCVPNQAN